MAEAVAVAGSLRRAVRRLAGGCLVALAALAAHPAWIASGASHATEKPSLSIPVEPLGYGRPGDLYLTMRYSMATLDFLDRGHLLFTFQKKGLLRHTPDSQPDDDDQLIHAVVLEVPGGKPAASADWRMHDRQHYLWPLGNGVFLVRQRDSLFLTDSSLQLHPWLKFTGYLASVQVSPEGSLVVAESEEPESAGRSNRKQTDDPAGNSADAPPASIAKPILLRLIRVKDRALLGQSRVRLPVLLPINAMGYVESLPGKRDQWVLSFAPIAAGPPPAGPRPFAEVSSTCQPNVTFLNSETVMAGRCSPSREHLATALTLEGKKLWEHRWQSNRIWPSLARSEDGSRFAWSTLLVPESFSAASPLGANDVSGQLVEVFDTLTGKLLLSAPASPVYDAGQNYALSPDGRRFAILHEGCIEIYDLPAEPR